MSIGMANPAFVRRPPATPAHGPHTKPSPGFPSKRRSPWAFVMLLGRSKNHRGKRSANKCQAQTKAYCACGADKRPAVENLRRIVVQYPTAPKGRGVLTDSRAAAMKEPCCRRSKKNKKKIRLFCSNYFLLSVAAGNFLPQDVRATQGQDPLPARLPPRFWQLPACSYLL